MNDYYKIKNICKIKGGKRIPKGEVLQKEKNSHPYIRILDMYQGRIINISKDMLYAKESYIKQIKNYIVNENDVILAIVGNTLGMVSIIGNTLDTAQLTENCCKFVDIQEDKINRLFLYYALISPLNQNVIKKFRVGSSQPKLPLYNVGELLVPKFTLAIQSKISNLLSNIDSKIELNNKINNELESMAKTIYDYWFLQFEFPNEEGKPYKSSGGKMVWNEELKREIPEGWINGHLKEYIKNQKAGDWGKENAIDNYQKEVTCIRGADFSSITSFEKMDMPRRFILEKNSFKLLSVYDLLIEISGGSPIQSTGRICYINDAVLKRFSTKLITSNFCKAISLTDNNYFYWFYMLWKTLYINNVFFNYESKTTGIKNLLFDIMCEKYPICKPPIQIIRLYNQQVTPYFNKIQQNIIENQELTSLRDFLLPLLMNGQVGFKEDKAEG